MIVGQVELLNYIEHVDYLVVYLEDYLEQSPAINRTKKTKRFHSILANTTEI